MMAACRKTKTNIDQPNLHNLQTSNTTLANHYIMTHTWMLEHFTAMQIIRR